MMLRWLGGGMSKPVCFCDMGAFVDPLGPLAAVVFGRVGAGNDCFDFCLKSLSSPFPSCGSATSTRTNPSSSTSTHPLCSSPASCPFLAMLVVQGSSSTSLFFCLTNRSTFSRLPHQSFKSLSESNITGMGGSRPHGVFIVFAVSLT